MHGFHGLVLQLRESEFVILAFGLPGFLDIGFIVPPLS